MNLFILRSVGEPRGGQMNGADGEVRKTCDYGRGGNELEEWQRDGDLMRKNID
jgi:hypothetical protein